MHYLFMLQKTKKKPLMHRYPKCAFTSVCVLSNILILFPFYIFWNFFCCFIIFYYTFVTMYKRFIFEIFFYFKSYLITLVFSSNFFHWIKFIIPLKYCSKWICENVLKCLLNSLTNKMHDNKLKTNLIFFCYSKYIKSFFHRIKKLGNSYYLFMYLLIKCK